MGEGKILTLLYRNIYQAFTAKTFEEPHKDYGKASFFVSLCIFEKLFKASSTVLLTLLTTLFAVGILERAKLKLQLKFLSFLLLCGKALGRALVKALRDKKWCLGDV